MLYAHNNAFANPSSGASAGSLTEDGAGGAYNDTLQSVSADGRTLTLKSTPRIGNQHFIGAAVYVLAGRGAGQFRRVISYSGTRAHPGVEWTISAKFGISLDTSDGPDASFVVIGPYRGKFIWTGNSGVDNQGMWLWGSSINVILANNALSHSQAFVLWPQDEQISASLGDGAQPNFRVQILDNTIVNGMTYDHGRWECAVGGSPPAIAGHLPPCGVNEQDQDGPRDYLQPSAGYQPGILIQEAIYNSTRPQRYFKDIPLTRGVIMKGNHFNADANIVFGAGSVVDVIVEGNTFGAVDIAFCLSVRNGQRGLSSVLMGENKLGGSLVLQCQNCAQAIHGGSSTLASRVINGGCKNYTHV
jgi:hypothetical protein